VENAIRPLKPAENCRFFSWCAKEWQQNMSEMFKKRPRRLFNIYKPAMEILYTLPY
jgi:hypothetical protein